MHGLWYVPGDAPEEQAFCEKAEMCKTLIMTSKTPPPSQQFVFEWYELYYTNCYEEEGLLKTYTLF